PRRRDPNTRQRAAEAGILQRITGGIAILTVADQQEFEASGPVCRWRVINMSGRGIKGLPSLLHQSIEAVAAEPGAFEPAVRGEPRHRRTYHAAVDVDRLEERQQRTEPDRATPRHDRIAEYRDDNGAGARRFALELVDDRGKRVRHAQRIAVSRRSNNAAEAAPPLPRGIGIDDAAPAAAVEWRPFALRLRQAVGHCVDHGGMMTHAAMAALDLDVLGPGRRPFHAPLPGADTVGAAEDRGGWHRWRFRQRSAEPAILFVGAPAARHFINPPGIGRLRAARKRTAKRDHRAHPVRHDLGELARIETAEAPADQTDLAAMAVAELPHQIDHGALYAVAQAEVSALAPAADGIAAVLQEAAQRSGRDIRSHQPRQYQHGMAVAPWREAQQRQRSKEGAQFVDGSPLQEHQGPGRRTKRLRSSGHRISFSGRPLQIPAA